MTQDEVHDTIEALTEAARVASVMIDGDQANRIITGKAMHYIAHPDPKHRFLSGDHYDVDHARFLRMKKTLLRLERLLEFACSTSLWVRVDGLHTTVTLAVQNGSVHRYYRFGEEKIEASPEMAECIETGQTVVAPLEHPSQTLTVLAPVFDSLGDVVGVVELSAQNPAARIQAPAWS
jgi:hypothetical protein